MRQDNGRTLSKGRAALVEETRGLLMDLLLSDPDVDIEGASEESRLDELGVDSLTYLDLFVKIKQKFGFEADVHEVVRHIRNHDIRNFGDLITQIATFIEIQHQGKPQNPAYT